jgi:hypothetical protein
LFASYFIDPRRCTDAGVCHTVRKRHDRQRTLRHGMILTVGDPGPPAHPEEEPPAETAPITRYKARRPIRLERSSADRLDALTSHVRLLRDFATKAFEERNADYFGDVAAKLRLLVGEQGNQPLLLNLMDEMGEVPTITLGGPPIQRSPGQPGPGDQLTLREYLDLDAVTLSVPGRGLISFTKRQLIVAWAQQVGGAHEDRAIDEELAQALYGGLEIGGLPAAAAELAVTTRAVLFIADAFLEAGAKRP